MNSTTAALRDTLGSSPYLTLERLRGRPIGRLVERLQTWQTLATHEFRRLVRLRLSAALERAKREVPFYSRGPWFSTKAQDLYSWPVLEREAVRAHERDLLARPRRLGTSQRYGGAVDGSFLRVAVDPLGAAWNRAAEHRALGWHGLRLDAPTLALGGERARLENWMRNRRQWCDADLHPDAFREVLAWITTRRPELGCGTPTAFLQLARFAEEHAADLPSPLLDHVQLGGEQLFRFQREEIEHKLGARCVEAYGAAEVGAIAGECREGSLHVFEEHVYVEILRGDRPAAPGELGDVAVTSLTNSAMPLIRCRLGDRARLLASSCRCGLPHPVLLDLQGRAPRLLVAPDGSPDFGSRLGRALRLALPALPADAVRGIVFERLDAHSWRVQVEGGESLAPAHLARLHELAREVFGSDGELEVLQVARIPADCRGRYRYYTADASDRSGARHERRATGELEHLRALRGLSTPPSF